MNESDEFSCRTSIMEGVPREQASHHKTDGTKTPSQKSQNPQQHSSETISLTKDKKITRQEQMIKDGNNFAKRRGKLKRNLIHSDAAKILEQFLQSQLVKQDVQTSPHKYQRYVEVGDPELGKTESLPHGDFSTPHSPSEHGSNDDMSNPVPYTGDRSNNSCSGKSPDQFLKLAEEHADELCTDSLVDEPRTQVRLQAFSRTRKRRAVSDDEDGIFGPSGKKRYIKADESNKMPDEKVTVTKQRIMGRHVERVMQDDTMLVTDNPTVRKEEAIHKDEFYEKIADQLADIGDNYIYDHLQSNTRSPLEKEILEELHRAADHIDANKRQRNNVKRTLCKAFGNENGWKQIAAVFSITGRAIQAVRITRAKVVQIKKNSLRIIDKFADWIVGHGGWESMLSEDSDDSAP